MNGKAVAFSVAMLMCFAGFLVIDSDDSYADTSYPITGELVSEVPDAMDAVIAEDLEYMNTIVAKFTLNSVIAGDEDITFVIENEAEGFYGLAIAMAFNADGSQYKFMGADSMVIKDIVSSEASTLDTGFTASQAKEELIGGSVYIAVGTEEVYSIDAVLKVMAGDVQICADLVVDISVDEFLDGKIIGFYDLPEVLTEYGSYLKVNVAAEYTITRALFSDAPIFVSVDVDRDVVGNYYIAVFDKNGEIRNGGSIIQGELDITAGVTTFVPTGFTINEIFTMDNVGGKAYILVTIDDTSTLKGSAQIIASQDDDKVALSNEVTYVHVGQTTSEETINGNEVTVTEFEGFYPDMAVDVNYLGTIINVDNTGATDPIVSLSIVEQDEYNTLLNAAMTSTVNKLDVGDADRSLNYVFDISFAGNGKVIMDVSDIFDLEEGQELRIVCIDADGNIVTEDSAVIEDGSIIFNHNSTYVLYVYEAPHVISPTAMAMGAGIAVIVIVAAVLSIFVMVRKD